MTAHSLPSQKEQLLRPIPALVKSRTRFSQPHDTHHSFSRSWGSESAWAQTGTDSELDCSKKCTGDGGGTTTPGVSKRVSVYCLPGRHRGGLLSWKRNIAKNAPNHSLQVSPQRSTLTRKLAPDPLQSFLNPLDPKGHPISSSQVPIPIAVFRPHRNRFVLFFQRGHLFIHSTN
jgi:hypothetical protein